MRIVIPIMIMVPELRNKLIFILSMLVVYIEIMTAKPSRLVVVKNVTAFEH